MLHAEVSDRELSFAHKMSLQTLHNLTTLIPQTDKCNAVGVERCQSCECSMNVSCVVSTCCCRRIREEQGSTLPKYLDTSEVPT